VLGAVLHRPAFLPVPAAALRVLLGEMSDALLLASTRVAPRRLLDSGFAARDPDLDGALRDMLGRGAGEAA
jgi:NAD dependent epimerase/dehydratase family enzyme